MPQTDYYQTPEYLRLAAAMNRRYAEANLETYARTNGRLGSIYMAEVHEACAGIKERQATELEQRA